MDSAFNSFVVGDRSMLSYIKREIHNLVLESGFSPHRAAETDIVLAELTSNLIKFAGSGELLFRRIDRDEVPGIELYCMDNGPGIENIAKMFADGYSTSNTLGHGLGAVKRLSDTFEIYSIKGRGTVQHARIFEKSREIAPERKKGFTCAAVMTNYPGETVCGDGYFVKPLGNGLLAMVGDGLGHGAYANEAVQAALQAFRYTRLTDPAEIIREIHMQVKRTRGLVCTVAHLDKKAGVWSLCGVGNIATRIYLGLENKTYTPYNGIIGHNIPRTMNNTLHPFSKDQMLVMCSDGIRTKWKLSEYPALLKEKPGLIAAAIYKENWRGTDDATVLVSKFND